MSFAVSSVVVVVAVVAATVLGGGIVVSAASDNVFIINNASDLIKFSNNVNSGADYSGTTVLLGSDIDFGEDLSQQFLPIGKDYNANNFLGTFDGQGHTVLNLRVDSSLQNVGLFGISRGCTIRNVVVDGSCSFASNFTGYANVFVGGVIGYAYANDHSSTTENCVNMASVSFAGNTTGSAGILYLGGIVGKSYPYCDCNSTVKNCVNYGSVIHDGTSSYTYIGGITGSSYGGDPGNRVHIQNCLNYGEIVHKGTTISDLYIGGIVGWSAYNGIENCVSAGRIESAQANIYIGSIIGYIYSYTNITHSFWSSDVGYSNAIGSGS